MIIVLTILLSKQNQSSPSNQNIISDQGHAISQYQILFRDFIEEGTFYSTDLQTKKIAIHLQFILHDFLQLRNYVGDKSVALLGVGTLQTHWGVTTCSHEDF